MINFSQETKKKWINFKKRRRSYYSAVLLLVFFLVSLFANFYSNPKPFMVKSDEEFYFPIFKVYPETTFGGIFETETEYSDPFIKETFNKKGNWAVYPPIRWDYKAINFDPSLQHPSPPSKANLLGTDNRGRDVFARLIYGFRISIVFSFVLAFLDGIIGIIIGSIEGFFGGKVDLILQRLIEVWSSIPYLYTLILLASIFEPSISLLIIILSIFGWIGTQALVRVEFLKCRNREYVKAAKALGVGNFTIMIRHILPNALTMVITRLPFSITGGMTALVSLDFLGLGVPSPAPSLGESLSQGLGNLEAWWIGLPTIATLMFILLLITFVGEAVLEVFDPKRS